MADNTTLDAGVGGDAIRDKDRAGVKTQIVGLDLGIGGGSEVLMTSAALADGTSNPTTAPWAGMLMCYNGATWDRVRGDTTNGVDVDVTRSALPTGASTAAKQPALGTAGAASADVITIQGIASGTVVPVSGPLTDAQLRASAVPVDTELPAAAALADAAANPTAPAVGAFALLWNGATWDRCPGGATNGLTANLKALNGTTIDTNSGAKSAGTQRVILASDQTVVPISDNAGSLTVDAPVGTPAFVRLSDGSAAITALPVTDNSGSLTVDAPVGTPVFVTPTPSATGGWSKIKYAAQTTTVQTPKGTAANFGGFYYYNPNASVAYVQVFDAATATTITLGTTVPDMIFGVPASSGAVVEVSDGVNMTNGIKLACTTSATGLTAPGSGLDLTVLFK